jgi:hypothetical protein
MPKFLAWDIGIKNLAYNLIDYKHDEEEDPYKILEWGIINLVEEEQDSLPYNAVTYVDCSMTNKTGKKCCQKAKYIEKKDMNIGYCGKHQKDLTKNNIELIQIKAKMGCIHYNDKTNKNCNKKGIWLNTNNPYIRYCQTHYKSSFKNSAELQDYYMDPKHASKVKQFSIKDLSIRLFEELENHQSFLDVEEVIIENQPVFKNPTMKSVQMLLYSHFIMNGVMKNTIKNISFFMAGKKLEGFTGNHKIAKDKFGHLKSEYKQTKNSAVLFTKEMLKNTQPNWYKFLNDQTKKDDLADAFLTNCCYIQNTYVKGMEKQYKKDAQLHKKLEKESKKLEKESKKTKEFQELDKIVKFEKESKKTKEFQELDKIVQFENN